jgi:hypothetical protein
MAISRWNGTGLAFALVLAAGCGAQKQTALAGDPSSAPSDGGSSMADPGSASDDAGAGTGEQFAGTGDAASSVTADCMPGTYAGTFETKVSSDAGGLGALISFDFKGTLSLAVVGQTMMTAGEVPTTTYSIAPGAKLDGQDQSFGGTYNADLTGQLDCASKTFSGLLNDGAYTIVFDAGSVPLTGSVTGIYDDGEGGPPRLTGTMILTSPNIPDLAATGEWTATLQ